MCVSVSVCVRVPVCGYDFICTEHKIDGHASMRQCSVKTKIYLVGFVERFCVSSAYLLRSRFQVQNKPIQQIYLRREKKKRRRNVDRQKCWSFESNRFGASIPNMCTCLNRFQFHFTRCRYMQRAFSFLDVSPNRYAWFLLLCKWWVTGGGGVCWLFTYAWVNKKC